MVIIPLILILVTYIDLWYYDLAIIFIWTWLYIILCIDVLTLALKILDLYSSVLPSLGRIEVVIPTIVLAC